MPAATLQKVFKTLNDHTRLRLLALLEQEELAVQELTQVLDMAQSTVSRHLGILKEAGLLQDRRVGTYVYYRYVPSESGAWREAWDMVRRSLRQDSSLARDQAALSAVLLEREAGSRDWFDSVGPEWDAIRKVFRDDIHRARAITRLLPRGMRVADIGTGTGVLARELAAAGVDVIAVDNSPRMLESAKANMDANLPGKVELRLGEANRLPLEDQEVQVAMAHMVLHYLASPAATLQEMARVISVGGKVVVVDFVQHENDWMKKELGTLWQGFHLDDIRRWFTEAGLSEFYVEVDEAPGKEKNLPATFIASATKLPQGAGEV